MIKTRAPLVKSSAGTRFDLCGAVTVTSPEVCRPPGALDKTPAPALASWITAEYESAMIVYFICSESELLQRRIYESTMDQLQGQQGVDRERVITLSLDVAPDNVRNCSAL
jgi:hypothetical protein